MTPPATYDVVRERLTLAHGVEDGKWTILDTELGNPSWSVTSPIDVDSRLWFAIQGTPMDFTTASRLTFFPLRPQDV